MASSGQIPVGDPLWKSEPDHQPAAVTPLRPASTETMLVLPAKPAGPKRGLAGWAWRTLGWRMLARVPLAERLDNTLDQLWQRRADQRTIAFVSPSNTSAAAWYAAAAAWALKASVAAVDTIAGTGQLSQFLASEGTLGLAEFVQRCQDFGQLQPLLTRLGRHRQTGVFTIAASPLGQTVVNPADFYSAMTTLRERIQLLVYDCSLGSLNLAAGSDVLVVFDESQRLEAAARSGLSPERVLVLPPSRFLRAADQPIRLDKLSRKHQLALFDNLLAILSAALVDQPQPKE